MAHLLEDTLAGRFSAIYRNRVWLNDRRSGSLSGLGSEGASTAAIRRELPAELARLGAETLLDVGCGDFTWMNEVELPCRYIGIDIVPDVVAAAEMVYGSATRSFLVLDATSTPLPAADIVLCREVLFHLSFADIWRLLANVRRSGARFLIATNDTGHRINADILSGDFRLLNLRRPPFRFPEPRFAIPDRGVVPTRTLSVWGIPDIPNGPEG